MSRRRRRAEQRRRKDMIGVGLIVLTLLAIAAAGFSAARLGTPAFDAATLCLTDAPPPAHTVILVDATDALDVRQVRRLRTIAQQEAARLPRWGRLTLESLSPNTSTAPRRLFTACTPGDRTSASPLWENVSRLEDLKRTQFDAPLEGAIGRRTRTRASTASPIIEGLAAVTGDAGFQGPRRRLVLVSDLLQHMPGHFSAYAPGASWSAYQSTPGALRTPPDLSEVSVRVVTLERADRGPVQTAVRTGFWEPYFAAAGAAGVVWEN